HVLPEWYRQILPDTSGMPTPEWDALSAMRFMADYDIKRSVVSVSTPGALVYLQDEKKTIAIARLLNEVREALLGKLVETYPDKFSFFAVIPLPYTDAAVREANYALDSLGAVGVGLLSSHAGKYLGDADFKPFFENLNNRKSSREIIYIHPTEPVVNVNGSLVSTNPFAGKYSGALAEFYYDTGRTLMDLTLTQTLFNFTKIHYAVSQVGGAFPSLIDRFLRSYPQFSKEAMEAYRTRFWWDSAGPTYPSQVQGLLGYNVPKSQLTFGSVRRGGASLLAECGDGAIIFPDLAIDSITQDYPYGRPAWYRPAVEAIKGAKFLSEAERDGVFGRNAERLLEGKIAGL
ncbi:amidohydrolase 2, partial [Phyllosticta citribraziliensis]